MTTRFSYSNLTELIRKEGRYSAIRGYELMLYHLTVGLGGRNRTVVELGTRAGWSTRSLLAAVNDAGGHLYSIDTVDCGGILKNEPYWTFILGNSLEVARTWDKKVDHLFIDTVHTFDHTLAELRSWYHFIKENGIITLHDTELEKYYDFGVKRAVLEFLKEHPELSFENDTTGEYGLGILRRGRS